VTTGGGMTKLEQARIEARAAVAVAEDKLARLSELRWAEAEERVGSKDFVKMLGELEKLPDVPWSAGCWYSEAGGHLEVFWGKPKASVMKWVNHFVSLRFPVDDDGAVGDVPIGCHVSEVKGMLERAGVYLTPDPPNPSRAVEEARAAGVCRVCREPLVTGSAPAKAAERFGSQVHPNALVFNCGEEYAHQACLNQERAEGEAA